MTALRVQKDVWTGFSWWQKGSEKWESPDTAAELSPFLPFMKLRAPSIFSHCSSVLPLELELLYREFVHFFKGRFVFQEPITVCAHITWNPRRTASHFISAIWSCDCFLDLPPHPSPRWLFSYKKRAVPATSKNQGICFLSRPFIQAVSSGLDQR